ncbi:serine/threonine protein kinase [Oceanisphaera pacifica]|uniref:Stress response kinase A n=1 Tax=Oceanisphaera pacifica TaxID=2818389 RepID=A0ABS3NJJ6_9GAMM|nr:serine/threonine protein kinase [Oceanisphaera pacifica]MBO1520578.1 serine/threonine protein kinase [Oceanisphaera pacifica]
MNYYQLTPDVILDALLSVDIEVDSGLMALNSYENRVYRFKSEKEGSLVVKFYRPERWSLQQIQEEHDFLFAAAQAGVRVVAPITRQQSSVFVYQNMLFAVWPAVSGRQLESDNLEQLEAFGEQIGRLHEVGANFKLAHRPQMRTQDYLLRSREVLQEKALIPKKLRKDFFKHLDSVIERSCELYQPKKQLTIHCDSHGSNVLWNEGPWLLDFDDCRRGPAVQDLWMMQSGTRQEQLMQLDALLAGYESIREFDNSELALIEPLRAMRIINYMAWLANRWSDPAFVLNFPWFNTQEYWQQQIGVLSEQRQSLDAEPLSLTSWN